VIHVCGRNNPLRTFAVIFPAAGRSARYGTGQSKLLEVVAGKTVVRRAVEAFSTRADVDAIVIAAPPEDQSTLAGALSELAGDSRIVFCAGGRCRAESVRNALQAVPSHIDWVAVHDAARPLVSQTVISRTFDTARQHGAAVPAMPVALTIKQAKGPLPAKVQRTVPRHELWAMQTPQAMRRADLLAAFESCPIPLDQITDDAQVLELSGRAVWLVEGEERNLKVTTPADLQLAEMFLARP
jgi:2-C-methyl-D-erythritol 4-phosphate cytidylyltransferase